MVMSVYSMNTKTIASTSGIEQATTSPARRPRLTKLTMRTITTASNSACVKPPTAFTTRAWFDTWCTPTPTGSSPVISACARIERLAELEDIAALLHRHRQADGRLAPAAEQRGRRVDEWLMLARSDSR